MIRHPRLSDVAGAHVRSEGDYRWRGLGFGFWVLGFGFWVLDEATRLHAPNVGQGENPATRCAKGSTHVGADGDLPVTLPADPVPRTAHFPKISALPPLFSRNVLSPERGANWGSGPGVRTTA
jgi:hypothetical protein